MNIIQKLMIAVAVFSAGNVLGQKVYAQNPFGTTAGTTAGNAVGSGAIINPAQISGTFSPNATSSGGFRCTQNGQGIFICSVGAKPSYTPPPASGIGATIGSFTTDGTPTNTIPTGTPFVMPSYTSTGGGLTNPTGPYNSGTLNIVGGSNGPANSQATDLQDITTTRSPFISVTMHNIGGVLTRYYLQAASASTAGCRSSSKIDSLYIRSIDFNYRFITISGPVDYIEMLPFESASYKFTVPTNREGFKGQFQTEQAAQATHVGYSVSISEQPCDFQVDDPNNTYTNPSSGVVGKTCLQENRNFPSIYWQITSDTSSRAASSDYYTCRLTPGKTYYINIKHAVGATNDLCYDHNINVGNAPGSFTVCGGIAKF